MLGLIPAILISSQPVPEPVCQVGKVAIIDLLKPQSSTADHFYGNIDPARDDLLDACPALKDNLPSGYSPANAEARRRNAAFRNEFSKRPAYIHSIGIPKFSSDGKTATVEFITFCGASCAGGERAVYVLSNGNWKRDSGPVTVWAT